MTGEQPAAADVIVRSQIVKANGEPVNVDYMMRRILKLSSFLLESLVGRFCQGLAPNAHLRVL